MKNKIYLLLVILMVFIGCSKGGSSDSNCIYDGYWTGTYSGDESGIVYGSISNCSISGYVDDGIDSYPVSGSVTNNGAFSATAGSASTGAVFQGQLSGNTGSGTWINASAGLQGTWEVTKSN